MSIAKSDSPYYDNVMSLLFSQDPSLARAAIYDADMATPEHGSLTDVIEQRVREVFVLHGAVQMHPQLLIPALTSMENDKSTVYMLDRQGDLVTLPRNNLISFARLAARTGAKRIKRYHMGDVYRSR
jgi:translation initiation factor 2-alpha kinase 4